LTDIEIIKNKFNAHNKWALVIGDLMLDRYLIGNVSRISPEAPVPVVRLKESFDRIGGSGNVAANLSLLGIKTVLAGQIGIDIDGKKLLEILKKNHIGVDGILKDKNPTTTKTRIIGEHQQMIRIDQEATADLIDSHALIKKISLLLNKKPAIVILSDYAKGVLSDHLCQHVIKIARLKRIPVLVDPKGNHYEKYKNATAITPNKKEAIEACHIHVTKNTNFLAPLLKLKKSLNLKFIAMTKGEDGIDLIQGDTIKNLPTVNQQQVFDVSGAGDTVIATLAACMIAKMPIEASLNIANIAAGIVIGKLGTIPITHADLIKALNEQHSEQEKKIHSLESLIKQVGVWKKQKKKIVFTNGCFDILHAGHVTYLEKAKKLGDILILALNSDSSVTKLKGKSRPVINQEDRARVLAALSSTDGIVIFSGVSPLHLIKKIQPDILVKGSDYKKNQVVGYQEVKRWNGKVELISIVPGRSTSAIIKKIS
jgi:D-beta-D-heptose 7-phosphate kinase/D-beta-D-heptose 1-phosphate adenosyltransferase